MTERESSHLTSTSDEHRRIGTESYERARQAINAENFDYAIDLLLTCCKIDPANVLYRQTLRRTQKAKYQNNMRGSRFAALRTSKSRARLKVAKSSRDYLRVLEYGEEILSRNPWDVGAQMDMAQAFEALALDELAIFSLEGARQKNPKDSTVNRALARLLEKLGRFGEAIKLWQLVREADPSDVEAAHKAKDLAASETIQRGRYVEHMANRSGKKGNDETESEGPVVDRLSIEAKPLLDRIEKNPTSPTPYTDLATLYRRFGKQDRARAVLQQGLSATGQNPDLILEIMELDLEPFRRNLKAAEKQLRRLKEDPETDEVDHTPEELERIRHRLLKEINAREIEIYRTRADNQSNDMSVRLDLGIRLLRADRIDEAIMELQQTRREERFLGRASMYLGFCFRQRNNWKLAKRNFEEALEHLPTSEESARKEVLFQLASGHAEAGELEQALELGNELANLDFSFRDIGKHLDDWERQLQG